jgi:hypothetical protein
MSERMVTRVIAQVGHPQVQRQQRHGDREHRVGQAEQPTGRTFLACVLGWCSHGDNPGTRADPNARIAAAARS